ncbi:MAG TPA: hypothetical protein DEF42_01555 [Desulfosporosinus sp.]|nr:hypothetical protein [Desulfosporosinus sp.]
MKKLLTSIVAVATMVLMLVPSFAMAAPNTSDNKKATHTKAELDERFQQIHLIIRSLVEEKTTAEEVLVELSKIDVYPGEDTTLESLKSLKSKPQKDSLTSDSITPMSNPDYAIDLPKPIVFQDTSTGYMYVGAHFFWESPAYWKADFPNPWPAQPGYGVAIGGNDGFGVYMSQPINRVSNTFDVYDADANRTSYPYASSSSQYGVGYTKQDYGYKAADGTYGYNWDSGYLGMYFTPVNSGRQMSVYSSLNHTWASTSVSITGISYVGITWQVANPGYNWDIVSDGTLFTAY